MVCLIHLSDSDSIHDVVAFLQTNVFSRVSDLGGISGGEQILTLVHWGGIFESGREFDPKMIVWWGSSAAGENF